MSLGVVKKPITAFLVLRTYSSVYLRLNMPQFGGSEGRKDGYQKQHSGLASQIINPCQTPEYVADFCSNNKVTTAECVSALFLGVRK